MAVEGDNIVRFTYTGEDGEIIPDDATHVFMDVKIIPTRAFHKHASIIEVICHDRVKKIEDLAFCCCPSLRRVIMRGVKTAEWHAFGDCEALTDVECGKLKIIGYSAFYNCKSLRRIDLPSAEVVKMGAFNSCRALKEVKFSNKLERFDEGAIIRCSSLERIRIPLKDGMITNDNMFMRCENLKHVDLVEGALLHETIAALHMEDWRNDMYEEITSINQILPKTPAGADHDVGKKALVIRRWIRSVLGKMVHYKAEHQRVLNEAATTLQQVLPQDLVMNNVLSFLELPPHRFGEDM